MSHRLHLALFASMLGVAATALSVAPAHAHRAPYRACLVAHSGAWLYTDWCHHHRHRCRVPIPWGRAFRVERQSGAYLRVWNLEASGWVELGALTLAPQAYCRAAGI